MLSKSSSSIFSSKKLFIFFIFSYYSSLLTTSGDAKFIEIDGCPSLYTYVVTPENVNNTPACFCDNATVVDDDPSVIINCFTQSTLQNLTDAIRAVNKARKRVQIINVEYMKFDDQQPVSIPDEYFLRLNATPYEITIVACQNDRLTLNGTFKGLEKTLKKLEISACNLITVPPSLSELQALEKLTLRDTYIYTFKEHDFRSLRRVKYLDLIGNQAYVLEDGVFDAFSNVEIALLGPRNALNTSAFGELNKLTNARVLSLENNAFDYIPDYAFESLHRLEFLDLTANYIVNISSFSFDGLGNLTYLNMSINKIRRVDDGAFSSLSKLKFLSLDSNFIVNISEATFDGLTNLDTLMLGNNNFERLDNRTFAGAPRLHTLNLDKNHYIYYMNDDAFDGLNELKVLNLSDSNITAIKAEYFRPLGKSLRVIDYSKADVYDLTYDAFKYCDQVESLSLANAGIAVFPKDVFVPLRNLRNLDLSYIKWICDDKSGWLIDYLKSATNLTLTNEDNTACWLPLELRGQTLRSIDVAQLKPYVGPIEIDQPTTEGTTPWWQTTTPNPANWTNENDTDGANNSSLNMGGTRMQIGTTTTTLPPFGRYNVIDNAPDDSSSRKIKIVIAVVVSVAAVTTIIAAIIVVVIMRKRKRNKQAKQDDDRNKRDGREEAAEMRQTTHAPAEIHSANGVENGASKKARQQSNGETTTSNHEKRADDDDITSKV